MVNGAEPELIFPRGDLPANVLRELARLSLLAWPISRPNPAVACVVVTRSGKEFSGATEAVGGRHAEIVALDAYDQAGLTEPFDLYVTLEPCTHHGRTPPCLERLMKYPQLERLVFGRRDPSQRKPDAELSSGSGQTASPVGALDVLAKQCEVLEARPDPGFFVEGFLSRLGGRPRFFFKAAISADGYMGLPGERVSISGVQGRAFVQLLRSRMAAIMVGPGTVAVDQPRLDYRRPGASDFQADFLQPVRGHSPFIEALRTERSALLAQPEALCQPDRLIALSDRQAPPAHQESYLQMQRSLPGRFVAYQVPFEAQALRTYCANGSYNDVLIEGGVGLFSLFAKNLAAIDLIFILRSRTLRLGRGLLLPDFLISGPEVAAYSLGEDELLVFHPAPRPG